MQSPAGQRFVVDASLIEADANWQNSTPKVDWDHSVIDPSEAPHAVVEYLDVLDDAAFGADLDVKPKFTSHSDPAIQCLSVITCNHLPVRNCSTQRPCILFVLDPERIIADTTYGSGPMLGWLVDRGIAPHIPVLDNASRNDGTWSREDFKWDPKEDQYICPEGQSISSQLFRSQSRSNHVGQDKRSRA